MADPVTPESIAEAANAPASASADGRSASAVSIDGQKDALELKETRAAASGRNPSGGAPSGWNMLAPATFVSSSTVGRR
ncbi:hypothetical protein VT84_33195 [Gemmata sp. SH-PL17]|uniref:hypothetical protein n=1 Tax=Gemmata sp. SH-PL17 TaxID=1630693 RepID=UPI00078CE6CE|nr:hypothetical protein [Gemmata sp. SH-PL17]AMV29299.1 hypothetical protein VT84_33195 [Gemmata sp. SH-PL17]